ncbi:MAG: hypothetical protein ACOC1I_02735 [Spirochaetota bacterium]
MGHIAKRAVFVVLLALVAAGAFAQMDMLPQIFRDLPPEFQQGLPQQMSFAEYRELNRNVDFFTMFMSLFVPGYGLFQVEHPELAWGIVGARFAGYGMMTAAVALQWNHFYNVFQEQALSDEDFQRLLVNSFIFGGGIVVSGLSWAGDVVLAYHIAKQEKDLVQYTYGVRAGLYDSASGGASAETDAEYLRGLLAQPDDGMVRRYLSEELPRYAADYPDAPFAGASLYFAAMIAAEERLDASALRFALRSAYLYPDGERAHDALRLVARLFDRNRSWRVGYDYLSRLASPPGDTASRDTRHFEAVRRLGDSAAPPLGAAALEEARSFLVLHSDSELVPEALAFIAETLTALGREDEASAYLAALVLTDPDRERWPGHALKLARIYLDRGDAERARILLVALDENAPASAEARTAREVLSGL